METYEYDDTSASTASDNNMEEPSDNIMPGASSRPGASFQNAMTPSPAIPRIPPQDMMAPLQNTMPPGSVIPGAPLQGSITPRAVIPSVPLQNAFLPGFRPQNTILWTWGAFPLYSASNSVAHVRFYNALANREPVDIYLNGRLVVSDLEYMNYTNYLHIVSGGYRLTVYTRSNPYNAIIDTNIQVRGNAYYTMAILGSRNNYSVQMIAM